MIIGIDIGTTTISAILFDEERKEVVRRSEQPNSVPSIPSGAQDPDLILSTVEKLIKTLGTDNVSAIAFSSQMHGIVYLDSQGKAVSPFYSWQNQWGAQQKEEGIEKGEDGIEREIDIERKASEALGFPVSTGYGIVTALANPEQPATATQFCNIGDYVAERLTGRKTAQSGITIASSMGIYDVKHKREISAFPHLKPLFPEIVDDATLVGFYEGIPVVTPLGDNQCAFLGSVTDIQHTMVLSYGTSGQLSLCDTQMQNERFEARPLEGDTNLLVAASLSGGDSYRLLVQFYERILSLSALSSEKTMYQILDGLDLTETGGIECDPYFLGRRDTPNSTASFRDITKANFTPEHFAAALLKGMVDELYESYESLPSSLKKEKTILVGTGNGLLKNRNLRTLVERKYQMPLRVSTNKEAGCMGAVINALKAIKCCNSYQEAIIATKKDAR